MKIHIMKDYLAVFVSFVGILLVQYDKCDLERKLNYYQLFLCIIVLIDGFFVFNKYAYNYNFGNNIETKTFFAILSVPTVLLIFYIMSCIA